MSSQAPLRLPSRCSDALPSQFNLRLRNAAAADIVTRHDVGGRRLHPGDDECIVSKRHSPRLLEFQHEVVHRAGRLLRGEIAGIARVAPEIAFSH
jgi:hypothetical protein